MITTMLLAATLPLSYQAEFKVGEKIDIAQGIYVCVLDDPKDTAARLLQVSNTRARRALALSRGCKFNVQDQPLPYRIKRVSQTICLDRTVGHTGMMIGGRAYNGPVVFCGREAHDLVIDRGDSIEQHVLWISLDEDE